MIRSSLCLISAVSLVGFGSLPLLAVEEVQPTPSSDGIAASVAPVAGGEMSVPGGLSSAEVSNPGHGADSSPAGCPKKKAAPSAGAVRNDVPALTLDDAIQRAMSFNATLQKARRELERLAGVTVETRARALPSVSVQSTLTASDQYLTKARLDGAASVQPPPAPSAGATSAPVPIRRTMPSNEQWQVEVRVEKVLFDAGGTRARIKGAKLTQEAAWFAWQEAVHQTVYDVRTAFYKVLLTRSLIGVQEQNVGLLEEELENQKRRFEAGTVPRFNVLRAEVELSNARPDLIRARNNYRLAQQQLARLLAMDDFSNPKLEVRGFEAVGGLDGTVREVALDASLQTAHARRPLIKRLDDLVSAEKAGITAARSGLFPQVSAYAGYGYYKEQYILNDWGATDGGYNAGIVGSWNVFDGLATQGKLNQAHARHSSAMLDLEDARRQVDLEVRNAYSRLLEAVELMESQRKAIEQAEESLRLANSRFDAGAGTQLDVLQAQVALTRARSIELQSRSDYNNALAELDRATGQAVQMSDAPMALTAAVVPLTGRVTEAKQTSPASKEKPEMTPAKSRAASTPRK
jgi:outer membrane protein TolC